MVRARTLWLRLVRDTMVAISVVVLAASIGAAGAARAGATPTARPPRRTHFVGSTAFSLTAPQCAFASQVFDATLGSKHPRQLHLDGCIYPVNPTTFSYTGTFDITAPHGPRLSGTVTGTVISPAPSACPSPPGASFDFVLTPSRRSRGTRHLVRPLDMVGDWCGASAISGTLTRGRAPAAREA